jgi:hypothetical protein
VPALSAGRDQELSALLEPPQHLLLADTLGSLLGLFVQSSCSECDVLMYWKVTDIDSDTTECEPLDAPTGFVCDHWRDHLRRWVERPLNPSRRANAGTVSERVLSKSRANKRRP